MFSGWLNWLYGGPKVMEARSPRWPALRAMHLRREPICQVCGRSTDLEVHHIKPVHLFPDLELEPMNLITLCQRDHLLFGHLDNWHLANDTVREDAKRWLEKIRKANEKS